MKRFIVTVLCVSVFFVGLGTLVENVGAKFKSDEKALALIGQARQAIGGEQSLAAVRSMTITGKATKTFEIEGAARTEQGDVEINLQLPDKFSKMMKIGKHDGAEGPGIFEKRVDVIVTGKDGEGLKMKVTAPGGPEGEEGAKHVVKVRKADGTVTDGEKGDVVFVRKAGDDAGTWKPENGEVRTVVINKTGKGEGHGMGVGIGNGDGHEKFRHNEMLRTTFALLLTAPDGLDVGYTYAGEESVDGNLCDVIAAEAAGSSFRIYLDRSSHLPKMMTFQGAKPMIFTFTGKEAEAKGSGGEPMVFTRKIGAPEMAQFAVKFSDYRSVNGVQLPFRWTQTVGGKDDEVIDITGYDINPANIADKFQHEKVFVRTKKPE